MNLNNTFTHNKKIEKEHIISVVLKVVLYLAMCFSTIPTSIKAYNLLPFYDLESYGIEDSNTMYVIARYIMPFFLGLIYYGLYCFFTNMITNNLNVRMRLFGLSIPKEGVRKIIDPVFILLCIVIGTTGFITMLYPLTANILSPIVRVLGASLAGVCIYFGLKKGIDDIYSPMIISALIFPIIIMVVII